MTVPVPVAGDEGVYTWGAAVANQLNREIQLMTTADQSSNSTTLVDIAGLTFPVVAGRQYGGTIRLRYHVFATNQGIQVAAAFPTGTLLAQVTTYGQGSPNGTTANRLTTSGTANNPATTDDSGSGSPRSLVIDLITYDCEADGTFAFQFRRGGTSGGTGVTILKGAHGLVLVSA